MCIRLGKISHLLLAEEDYCVLHTEILGLQSLSLTRGGRCRCRLAECPVGSAAASGLGALVTASARVSITESAALPTGQG